jgi:hypothetical protein
MRSIRDEKIRARGVLMAPFWLVLCVSVVLAGPAPSTQKPATAKPVAPRTAEAKAAETKATETAPKTKADTSSPASTAPKPTRAVKDTSLVLRGGADGTAFQSLTVQGEDRIQIDFERPPLVLDLDLEKAPGLEWGSAQDVLDRTVPDRVTPLASLSSRQPSPYVASPWITRFAEGAVARFRPQITDVERWRMVVANARGEEVASFQGKGSPPKEIVWDGHSKSGATVSPGLAYSYVFEAYDRAGNKRNFVGEAFRVTAYRLDTPEGPVLAFTGNELGDSRRSADAVSPIVREAATCLNQVARPNQIVRVTATARSLDRAQALAADVSRGLAPLLLGDPVRVQGVAEVKADAPEDGALRIATVK